MNIAAWTALLTPAIAVLSCGVVGVTKLTRMAVAIEGLAKSMNAIAGKVAEHETRLADLERAPGRSRVKPAAR